MKLKVFIGKTSFKMMYAFSIAEFKEIIKKFDRWEYVL